MIIQVNKRWRHVPAMRWLHTLSLHIKKNKGDMNNNAKKQLADAISNAQSDTSLSTWKVSNKPLY